MSYDSQKLSGKRVQYLEGDGDDTYGEPDPEFTLNIADLKQMCSGDTISVRTSNDSDNGRIILVTTALGKMVTMTNKEFIEFASKCPNIKM